MAIQQFNAAGILPGKGSRLSKIPLLVEEVQSESGRINFEQGSTILHKGGLTFDGNDWIG